MAKTVNGAIFLGSSLHRNSYTKCVRTSITRWDDHINSMQFYVELHPAGMGLLFHTSVSDIYDIGGVSSGPWMQGKKATMMREAFSKHNPMRPASLIHRSQPQASIRRVRSLRRRDLSKHPRSIPQNKCPSPRKANQQQEVC